MPRGRLYFENIQKEDVHSPSYKCALCELYFAKSARWVERKTAEIAKVVRLSGSR